MNAPRTLSSVSLALALVASACTVGPEYTPPQRELPLAWRQPAEAGLTAGAAGDREFWRAFGDARLDALVTDALRQNLDLRVALANLEVARSLRGVATADRWPSLEGRAGYEDRQDSRNTPFGKFIPRTDIHSIAVDAAWEIDLWGRVRRSVEVADAELAATEAEVRGAALSVAAEVVSTWVDLVTARRRLQIAKDNLSLQERTHELARTRFAVGLVDERDVAQAATNAESTRARLPSLEAQAAVAHNRLAVLLGKAPAQLDETLLPAALPVLSSTIAVGLPADLLRRRPDVQAAERRFAASVARIGAAEAEKYPRLSLAGTLGLAANAADDLFTKGSDVLAYGPSLRWTLFDGGRLRQRVRSLEAAAEAAQVAWEQVVLLALEEAENAMTRFVREQARRATLQRAAAQATRAVELAQTQYRAGLSDVQVVVDAERTLAALADEVAASDAVVAGAVVALSKALGGDVLPVAAD